jgi:hypothetical protein
MVTPDQAGVTLSGLAHLALAGAFAVAMVPLLRGPVSRLRGLLAVPVAAGPAAGGPVPGG